MLADCETSALLKGIDIYEDDIVLIIIKVLDEPHGCDNLSMRLIKIYGRN